MNDKNEGRGGPGDLLLSFFIYNFIGWIGESTYCSLGDGEIVNRGFLTGPQIPLYGSGGMLLYALLTPIKKRFGKKWYGPILCAVVSMIGADTLEYLTSLGMEKLFHARWWDYSEKKYNINGRICLDHTIYWALAGTGFIYVLSPKVMGFVAKHIPKKTRNILIGVCASLFTADVVSTVLAAININKAVRKLTALKDEIAETAGSVKDSAELLITPIKDEADEKITEIKEQLAQMSESYSALMKKNGEEKTKKSVIQRITSRLLSRTTVQREVKSRFASVQEALKKLRS